MNTSGLDIRDGFIHAGFFFNNVSQCLRNSTKAPTLCVWHQYRHSIIMSFCYWHDCLFLRVLTAKLQKIFKNHPHSGVLFTNHKAISAYSTFGTHAAIIGGVLAWMAKVALMVCSRM